VQSKDNYVKLSKEAELAIDAKKKVAEDAKNFKMLEKKEVESKQKAEKAEGEYKAAVDKYNELQMAAFKNQMPDILTALEELEKERYAKLQSVLKQFLLIQEAFPAFTNERLGELKTKVDEPSYETDWQEFLDANKPEKPEPEPAVFEPFSQ
jgi:hypothetical protein